VTTAELNARLDAYLAIRQALGFRLQAEGQLLRNFILFLESKGNPHPIRAYVAVEWACSSCASRGSNGQAARLSKVRKFLAHLRATIPETEVPDHGLLSSSRRPKPYLFSPEQIDRIIAAVRAKGPVDSLRPHTLSAVIRVLAATGLRVGEAIRLIIDDVKLDALPPHLIIRKTKFCKSRIVPIHPTTADMLRKYSEQRKQLHYDALADAFFVSERGGHLSYHSLWRWFARITRKLGMWPTAGRRPSLHCIRHYFAIRRILLWYQEGADVQALLPTLSVYLGHVRPQDSYWYLTATPELLGSAAERFRLYATSGGGQ
jgi:integrase/recombinase XerD